MSVRLACTAAVSATITALGATACAAGYQVGPKSPATVAVATCTNASAIRSWPLARRAAQLVVVPVVNFKLGPVGPDLADGAGGVLFFGNAKPPADLKQRIRSAVAHAPADVRPFVMADEEGGGIQRLAGAVTDMPWPRTMARTMTATQVHDLAHAVGRQMAALGVGVDLAPVLDVDNRPGPSSSNPDGERSFSGHPHIAAKYGVAFMRGLRAAGELSVVKHFPGLGGSTANTDDAAAATLPISQLRHRDLVAFRAAIKAGARAVMIANATVPGLTQRPASLSSAVIRGLLRKQLGFTGLVVTDSLSAGGIRPFAKSLPIAAVRAISAGADVILYGAALHPRKHAPSVDHFGAIVQAIVDAVHDGHLKPRTVNAAVLKVLAAKHASLCH